VSSETTVPPLALDAIGKTGDEVRYAVTPEAIKAFAAATDDASAAAVEGRIAPPVFAILPAWGAIAPASHAVANEQARRKVVHYAQDISIHRPIEAGMSLVTSVTPVALFARPNGSSLVMRTESRTDAGELVNEQFVTEFFRGVEAGDSIGEPSPDHRLTDDAKAAAPLAEITYPVAADQADRYAAASGDRFAIHLDDEFARSVGLPGRILHGFCTLAFMTRAVCEATGADPSSFTRLAARFSFPVFPGSEVTARIWKLAEGIYGYEALDGNGNVVLKDGRAELRGNSRFAGSPSAPI
jgi:acyl dehydratase